MTKTFRSNSLIFTLLLLSALFANCNQAEQKPVPHKIPIKVAIIYSLGGAQAVARENLYLLKKDAVQIWKETGVLKDEKDFGISFSIDRINVMYKKPSKFEEALKPYIVQTVTTDFEGNATFENVPEGEYFIYAATNTRGGRAVWNYKVSTTPENKLLFLDNKNAYYSQ
jgi:hypothetical protein